MKRVRREVSVDPELFELVEKPISYAPADMYEALMRNMDFEEDVESLNGLRSAVLNGLEQLSQKDQYCLQSIYTERITYNELGIRLGYKPQRGGSPQAFRATERALERLKAILVQDRFIIGWLEERGDNDTL